MSLYLLDTQLRAHDILEGYESRIWSERYDTHGECVLIFSSSIKKPKDFPLGWYLALDNSDELMVIQSSLSKIDDENGKHLEVKAKSLTSILTRRIIWNQTNLNSMLEPAVKRLLDENFLAPTDTARKIPNMTFAYAGGTVPAIYSVNAQYQGEQAYQAISDLCGAYDVGFRILRTPADTFEFRLYGGVNRSFSQDVNPHLVFSPEFDNLENASYFASIENYTNVVLVGGEGEGTSKKHRTVTRPNSELTGIDRYEAYHNAQNQSSNGQAIPAAQYNAFLDQRGREFLFENDIMHVFDGETDRAMSSGYGTKYFLGDIVQITDDDTISSPARIVEFIRSDDASNGVQEYPALRIKEDI